MPASAAAGTPPAASIRRLILLPREPRSGAPPEDAPRHYRLARLERTEAARTERFAHLKRQYD